MAFQKGYTPWNKGKSCPQISEALKGRESWWLGKHHSEDVKQKMSEAHKGKHSPNTGFKKGHIPWSKGLTFSEEYREKLSQAHQGQVKAGGYSFPEGNTINLGRKQSSELITKRIRAAMKAMNIKPNKPEQRLIALIETNRLPFKYVGDGEFILGGKCPDFLNTNGKKQLIELFGTYWHPIFNVAERAEHFRSYGFNTLVIWEDELGDEAKVLKKIKQFTRR